MTRNLQVLMARHPKGWVTEEDFRLHEAELPKPGPGEVLVRNVWLSVDPYMRGVMDPGRSYIAKVQPGGVMTGGTVGEIVESHNPKLPAGTYVQGMLGWQTYAATDGRGLRVLDPKLAPLSTALGVLGMPGVTAWIGLMQFGEPKPGETVVVSGAAGAVGGVVGQLARDQGCRAVGIAGGVAKCAYVQDELGFDACVDYKAGDLNRGLKDATPKGIDVYFDNVGGATLDAVLRRINVGARIPICGMISQYNLERPEPIHNLIAVIPNRARLQGFIVSDHLPRWPEALRHLAGLLQAGKLKYREDIADGLENAPKAFIAMLKGKNIGKQLVRIAPEKA